MGRELVFNYKSKQIPVAPDKVDRTKLYGSVDVEVLDSQGRPCQLMALAGDGQTLIGKGGTALAVLSADGLWLDRKILNAVDLEGNPLQPVPSSYSAPIDLHQTATIDQYLSHDLRLVYEIDLSADDAAALLADLQAGTILTFPYSYRGGLEADTAFLLCNHENKPFMVVGTPTHFQFVGFQEATGPVEEEPAQEEADDDLDFSMM